MRNVFAVFVLLDIAPFQGIFETTEPSRGQCAASPRPQTPQQAASCFLPETEHLLARAAGLVPFSEGAVGLLAGARGSAPQQRLPENSETLQ